MAISAQLICDELKKSGIEFVVTLPDDATQSLFRVLAEDKDIRMVQVCREEEGALICTGLHFGGKGSVLFMQNAGIFNCVNELRGVVLDLRVPLLMLVGYAGHLNNPGPLSQISKAQLTEPILRAMRIPYYVIEEADDVPKISMAHSYSRLWLGPVAILIAGGTT